MTTSSTTTTLPIRTRIAAFEQAAVDSSDPRLLALKISEKSDRKKYNFADGLLRDLHSTRAALKSCCTSSPNGKMTCTFGELYDCTEGKIANLNRVLQNLRKAREVRFEPECFFNGVHNDEVIELLDHFWSEQYVVNERNVFRTVIPVETTPHDERRGRSYFEENERTRRVEHCSVCNERVRAEERITIRCSVLHLRCISCAVCGACPRQKADYVTFDGKMCCGAACIRWYDAAHRLQERVF